MSLIQRRTVLKWLSATLLTWTGSGCQESLPWRNPCRPGPLSPEVRAHPLLVKAWQDVAPENLWDVHLHLAGIGDDPDSGIWIDPRMRSPWHPVRYATMQAMFNGSCVDPDRVDRSYVQRLLEYMDDFPPGAKLMPMAFDYFHDEAGRCRPESGTFYIPNAYAARVAHAHPDRLQWIASIHPHRADALERLARVAEQGAKAIKWLPQAMGIHPGSPRCDRFYEAMAHHGLVLLCHTGRESAVAGDGPEWWANPLLLRRPLDHGVVTIAAHCASDGEGEDLDQGPNGPRLPNYRLFFRLLENPAYRNRLYGDISAVVLVNREREMLEYLLRHEEWHGALLYGSDYPLPGIPPVIHTSRFVAAGLLQSEEKELLDQVRQSNPLLFNFLLMRFLSADGHRFSPMVFNTRRLFEPGAGGNPSDGRENSRVMG